MRSTPVGTGRRCPRDSVALGRVPGGRGAEFGTVSATLEEIAPMNRFLCTGEASYTSGAIFTVDGGVTAV